MGEINDGIKIRLLNHFCMVVDSYVSKDFANIANNYLKSHVLFAFLQ